MATIHFSNTDWDTARRPNSGRYYLSVSRLGRCNGAQQASERHAVGQAKIEAGTSGREFTGRLSLKISPPHARNG